MSNPWSQCRQVHTTSVVKDSTQVLDRIVSNSAGLIVERRVFKELIVALSFQLYLGPDEDMLMLKRHHAAANGRRWIQTAEFKKRLPNAVKFELVLIDITRRPCTHSGLVLTQPPAPSCVSVFVHLGHPCCTARHPC